MEYYQPKGERPLNRDNIGLLAKFADRNRPEKLLCVATTHLLYNPRRVDVRLAQIAVMLAGMYIVLYIPIIGILKARVGHYWVCNDISSCVELKLRWQFCVHTSTYPEMYF